MRRDRTTRRLDDAPGLDDAPETETAGPLHPAENVPGQVRAAHPAESVPGQAETTQPVADVPGQAQAGDAASRLSHMLRPRTREEWETLIGGKLLNRVGALALVLGVGFFLKYAFDNDWLNETARVILGGVAGLLLAAGGHRFHRRGMSVFAQGLTGAGVGILYLSIYAAYDFYRLIPQPVAFLLMALVTAAALLLSLRYDARAIALLGWAGGFLTPFLLVTAQLNTLGLFVYITLLDAGLIAVLLSRRHWRVLEPLGIAATYATYLTWSFRADLPEGFGTALAFLTLWWALFAWFSLYRSATGDTGKRRWRWIVVTVNALGFYVMLMRLSRHTEGIWDFIGFQSLTPQNYLPYSEGIATIILSLAYFALTAWITRNTDDRSAAAVHATAAILLAVRAPLSFFTPFVIVLIWAFEALVLFGFGVYREVRAVRHAGTALLALSFAGIFLFGGTYVSSLVSNLAPFSRRAPRRTGSWAERCLPAPACCGTRRINERPQALHGLPPGLDLPLPGLGHGRSAQLLPIPGRHVGRRLDGAAAEPAPTRRIGHMAIRRGAGHDAGTLAGHPRPARSGHRLPRLHRGESLRLRPHVPGHPLPYRRLPRPECHPHRRLLPLLPEPAGFLIGNATLNRYAFLTRSSQPESTIPI